MKLNLKAFSLASLLILAACSNDDTETITEITINQEAEQLESTPLSAAMVTENVSIAASNKLQGLPPQPNEAISLDISTSSSVALLNEGFEISYDSNAELAGAFLIFKGTDDVQANAYFDIDLSSNSSNFKIEDRTKSKHGILFEKEDETDENSIAVKFNSAIEPGTFCYEICVYDYEGNISAPEELCVTVQTWGGSDSLVGTWKFLSEEVTEKDRLAVTESGMTQCAENTMVCVEGTTLTYEYCTSLTANLEFKSDGTYFMKSEGNFQELNYEASYQNCEATYTNEEYVAESWGNWAYASNEQRLTLVEYEFRYTTEGESNYYVSEAGDGDLVFDGVAEIVEGQLVISSSGVYTVEDESFTVFSKIYFEK